MSDLTLKPQRLILHMSRLSIAPMIRDLAVTEGVFVLDLVEYLITDFSNCKVTMEEAHGHFVSTLNQVPYHVHLEGISLKEDMERLAHVIASWINNQLDVLDDLSKALHVVIPALGDTEVYDARFLRGHLIVELMVPS